MFGTLRTTLAIMVLIGHLTDQWQIGTYAVFGFYIISGYLMTHIMHESYGFTAAGRKNFAINRFIRLYPSYWVVIVLSVVVIYFAGAEFSREYNELMIIPNGASEWLSVMGMLYIAEFPNTVSPNIAPTTWAITVELFFYMLICLGLSKTKLRVLIWLVLSLGYIVYCQIAELSWPYKYFPIPAASFPFAVGAFIYFRKKEGYLSISDSWLTSPSFLITLLVSNAVATLVYPFYFQTGFYVSLLLSIMLCYELAMGRTWTIISRSLDKTLGDYSYPIYLLQWQAGLLVCYLIYKEPLKNANAEGYIVSGISLIVCVLIAWLIIRFIDKPLQNLKASKQLVTGEAKKAAFNDVARQE